MEERRSVPIHLSKNHERQNSMIIKRAERRRTGTESIVGPLELVARRVVLSLGSNALEVVAVILEARLKSISSWLVC